MVTAVMSLVHVFMHVVSPADLELIYQLLLFETSNYFEGFKPQGNTLERRSGLAVVLVKSGKKEEESVCTRRRVIP